MLLKSQISNCAPYTEFWHQEKIGKFSSSEAHKLMGDGKGLQSYIYRKVGESLTGVPAKNDIETEATANGHVFEPHALRTYMQDNNIPFYVESRLIHSTNPYFCSTPDGLIITAEREGGLGYDVIPVEVKCPLTYEAFLTLYLCETPQDLFKAKKEYFYQLMDQIDNCGALKGIFIVYHPDFVINGKRGLYKAIEFRIMEKRGDDFPMKTELDYLRQRKKQAIERFEKVKESICTSYTKQ